MIEEYYTLKNMIIERLQNTITNKQLIKYSKNICIGENVNSIMFNEIEKLYISGDLIIYDSKWNDDISDFEFNLYNLPKKPKFLNIDNYNKLKELSKNKNDWNNNWSKYEISYPVYGYGFCNYESIDNKSNAYIFTRDLPNIKCGDYKFILKIDRKSFGFCVKDKSQIYIFEFKDKKVGFINFFRKQIINQMAEKLIDIRYNEYINEEVNKCINFISKIC